MAKDTASREHFESDRSSIPDPYKNVTIGRIFVVPLESKRLPGLMFVFQSIRKISYLLTSSIPQSDFVFSGMSTSPDPSFTDYFSVLGVEPSTTEEELKRAYRDLAFEVHPDRNASAEAHQRFLQIVEAYQILSTPESRKKYLNQYRAHFPRQDQDKLKAALQQRTEFNRMKRSERYRSGRYTQRVRYRGSASGRASATSWENRPRTSPGYSPRTDSSANLVSDPAPSEAGFRVYSWLMSAIAVSLLLICLGMWADKAMTADLSVEEVKGKRSSSQLFIAMNGMKIRTTRHSFLIHGTESRKLPKGREVTLMQSPYGRFLTHVKVVESGFEWKFDILDGPYGAHFWMTYVIAFFSLLTLTLRKRYQGSAYVGTLNILIALSMMSLIFTT